MLQCVHFYDHSKLTQGIIIIFLLIASRFDLYVTVRTVKVFVPVTFFFISFSLLLSHLVIWHKLKWGDKLHVNRRKESVSKRLRMKVLCIVERRLKTAIKFWIYDHKVISFQQLRIHYTSHGNFKFRQCDCGLVVAVEYQHHRSRSKRFAMGEEWVIDPQPSWESLKIPGVTRSESSSRIPQWSIYRHRMTEWVPWE